jgi:hypothetical protein
LFAVVVVFWQVGGVFVSARVTREMKAAQLGLTPLQLDAEIDRFSRLGWSQRRIAKRFDMAPSAVHYALLRVKGVARKAYRYGICDGCGDSFPADQVVEGLCRSCASYVTGL